MKNFRRLPLEGLENARDLGGYATADGGVTKYHVFIRSEVPENMTPEDIAYIKELGIIRSVDLRSNGEIDREPSDLEKVEGIEYIRMPMFDESAAAGSASQRENRSSESQGPGDLSKMPGWDVMYIGMIENHKAWTVQLMDTLNVKKGAVHYNCFTGKDRTGLCTAMLLSIAGVSEEDICADYSLSMAYLNRRYANVAKMFPTPLDEHGRPNLNSGFFATLPSYMRNTLDYVDEHYGGMVGYLKACGVKDEVIAAIKEKLVEY
ncbi:MAG: tyrosine-protein phosphatase [Eubacteriales bacterium]|nr:tyrosine-protein phosphatase [Eubacteriales bacterium]